MKTLNIVAVSIIFNIERPIVVLKTSQSIDIARTPKQALLDLQNSGRALDIDPNLFNRGIGAVGVVQLGAFKKALFGCQGATVSGEIRPFKAGDSFVYSEGHPALTDKTHEKYGKVKLGDKGVAEKDGVWVDQFLNIPQTPMERQMELNASATANLFATMFGLVPQQGSQETIDVYEEPETLEEQTSNEAVGSKK